MSGYRSTPLPKQSGIKDGSVVAMLAAPVDFEDTLGDLPSGVKIRRQAFGKADVVLLFASSQAELGERFPGATDILADGGRL